MIDYLGSGHQKVVYSYFDYNKQGTTHEAGLGELYNTLLAASKRFSRGFTIFDTLDEYSTRQAFPIELFLKYVVNHFLAYPIPARRIL